MILDPHQGVIVRPHEAIIVRGDHHALRFHQSDTESVKCTHC